MLRINGLGYETRRPFMVGIAALARPPWSTRPPWNSRGAPNVMLLALLAVVLRSSARGGYGPRGQAVAWRKALTTAMWLLRENQSYVRYVVSTFCTSRSITGKT